MQNKSSKNWTDVQLILASISIALTLGFWSLLASQEKLTSGSSASTDLTPQPDSINAAPPALLPGQKLLFAGTVPQSSPAVVNAKRQGNRKGGAVTTTRSSRP